MFQISQESIFLLISILTGIVIFFFVRFRSITITEINIFNIFKIPSIQVPWAILIPFCIFISSFTAPVSLLPDISPIQSKGEPLIFGFGYVGDSSSVSQGIIYKYCSELEKHLKDKTKYDLRSTTISYPDRFKKTKDNLFIYCDTNTITKNRKNNLKKNNGEFSNPFFTNGTAMMIKLEKNNNSENQKKVSLFDKDSPTYLKNQKLGIIRNTTTYNIIKQIYPLLDNNKSLIIFETIEELYNKLDSEEISGYISDQIRLKDYIVRREPEFCYKIIPENHWLSYEEYGVVVYNINKEEGRTLLNETNDWIDKNSLESFEKEYKEHEKKYTIYNDKCQGKQPK